MRVTSNTALLRLWLSRAASESRWDALDRLCARCDRHGTAAALARLIGATSGDGDGDRKRRRLSRRRRRASIALLRLCAGKPPPDDVRLQMALARGLALALPRRLARPTIIEDVLSPAECLSLACEARAEGAAHGWGSLHRKYSTQDMPVERLPSGPRIHAKLRAELLPEFVRRFGPRFGPSEALRFVSLFVVRYVADTAADGGQRGLAGHVDESLLSFVLTLSRADAFDGGGTSFERSGCGGPVVIRPQQGHAVLFLGRVYHEALPIHRGERLVLVGLLAREETAARV